MAWRGGIRRHIARAAAGSALQLVARDRAQIVIPLSSHRVRSILPLAAFLAALAIGTAGCESAAIPAAATIVQGGVAAAGYSAIRAGEKSADKHTPGSLEYQEERCEALVGSAPDVEEVRTNKCDII